MRAAKFMILLCVFGNVVFSFPTTSDYELLYPGENAAEVMKSGRDDKQRLLLNKLRALALCHGEDCDHEVYEEDARDGSEDAVDPKIQPVEDVQNGKEDTSNPKIEPAPDHVLGSSGEDVVANATQTARDANKENCSEVKGRVVCQPKKKPLLVSSHGPFMGTSYIFTADPDYVKPEGETSIIDEMNAILYACALFAICAYGFLFWVYKRTNFFKVDDDDLPSYGEVGPNVKAKVKQNDAGGKGKGNGNGSDRQLAHSAQMYHYQHQKQQIISMQQPDISTVEYPRGSATESEEDDLTVYECPGLATTGEMTVENPLFRGEVESKSLGE